MNASASTIETVLHDRGVPAGRSARWEAFVARRAPMPLSYHPAWPEVLAQGLSHGPHWLEAVEGDRTVGLLPLAFVRSLLFGRFLVGLPYLNYGGVLADDEAIALRLVDRAIEIADALDVRHLELRHEQAVDHPSLVTRTGAKVLMRRPLPPTDGELWDDLSSGVRNQVRKARKERLIVEWGGAERIPEFHAVFSRNMRDLGTPAYGIGLFRAISRQFGDRAEYCVVRSGERPIAAALLLHGWGVTEVPSASSLREFNGTCANMLMYWELLQRSILRGSTLFDFGRSTPEGSVYRFKKQWGASPEPTRWQYATRRGGLPDLRPDSPRYRRLVRAWRRLPVGLTRLIGPGIVRGIP